ncbi:MAG: hypothetical protein DRR16_17145 [Candidatus Parabeggiatoa sp. nov. 3]|nr:MAG: hypothetical protein DRR00_09820 [Gammaproteobacteria bacterium]RKZ67472.1 MAG: hypothetical protein DRQ99_06645 [Gammaproteobacteria bacterium]RKZ83508.1 MAG: hypothetical protein DRR16_17145 [Gammaproteobacteria bacterium]HEW97522.1 HEPN domain-containing protein [Beggiatoa sp.]
MKNEFLAKAKENIVVATWAYENGHYNASANRGYYAAFQAAIAALANAGIINLHRISHSGVQSLFATELIRRRKIYPTHLKSYLADLQRIRDDADYELKSVSKKKCATQLKQAKEFVEIITKEIEK